MLVGVQVEGERHSQLHFETSDAMLSIYYAKLLLPNMIMQFGLILNVEGKLNLIYSILDLSS